MSAVDQADDAAVAVVEDVGPRTLSGTALEAGLSSMAASASGGSLEMVASSQMTIVGMARGTSSWQSLIDSVRAEAKASQMTIVGMARGTSSLQSLIDSVRAQTAIGRLNVSLDLMAEEVVDADRLLADVTERLDIPVQESEAYLDFKRDLAALAEFANKVVQGKHTVPAAVLVYSAVMTMIYLYGRTYHREVMDVFEEPLWFWTGLIPAILIWYSQRPNK